MVCRPRPSLSEAKARLQGVEDAGLAHTGIARKGGYLSSNGLSERRNPLAGFGADPKGGEARRLIDAAELIPLVQIALVDADEAFTALVLRDGGHPVNQKGVGHRHRAGGHHHHLVDVGHRRALKRILAGQDAVQHPRPLLQGGHPHPVPHQGGNLLVAEAPPGPALNQGALSAVHIIEAAEGF